MGRRVYIQRALLADGEAGGMVLDVRECERRD
jgi:hypothetical protein